MAKFFGAPALSPVALEELEIEKLLNADNTPESGLDFTNILEKTEVMHEIKEKAEKVEENDDLNDPGESGMGDGGMNDIVTGDPEGDTVDTTEEPDGIMNPPEGADINSDANELDPSDADLPQDQQVTAESLRNFGLETQEIMATEAVEKRLLSPAQYAIYNDELDPETTLRAPIPYAMENLDINTLGSKVLSVVKYLGSVGIPLTAMVAAKFYKGFLYVMGKIAMSLVTGIQAIDQYLERRKGSFEKLESNIDAAKKIVELLRKRADKSLTDKIVQPYDNFKVVQLLRIGDSTDIVANLSRLEGFLQATMKDIGRGIDITNTTLKQMLDFASMSRRMETLSLLKVPQVIQGMAKGSVEGFPAPSDAVMAYRSSTTLPGDVVLQYFCPRSDLKTVEEYAKAYQESALFLALDRTKASSEKTLKFMTPQELNAVLDKLTSLVRTAKEHQAFYESLKQSKLSLRYSFKAYFQQLSRRNHKVGIQESMVDLVYLKNSYTDKVYLPGAIDMHDYTVRVVVAALQYVERNVKALG